MPDLVQLSYDADVAVITVNNPPVNALSPGVPEGVQEGISAAVNEPKVVAIVLIGAGGTFVGGADIREFGKIVSGARPPLNLLTPLQGIEDSPKPVVMAIYGKALGAGLEIAMCGHYRVIVREAQVGQPEVKLGLIPGAGGTQRLPRLVGVPKALEMCTGGEPIEAEEAVSLGLVDQVIEGDLLTGALAFARGVASQPIVKTRDRESKVRGDFAALFRKAREQVRTKGRGLPAQTAAIDAIEAATELSFNEGCQREAELFNQCLFSSESKALIHAFFGERTVGKIPAIPRTNASNIQRAAIVGAGTMGGGIAMTYANAGIPVILKENTPQALERGLATIRRNYARTVAKGRLSQEAMNENLSRISPQVSYDGFAEADIIMEAVFESIALKKEIFSELDRIAKPSCILASNTSSLDIDEIASATSRPEMVVGNHFFSPANIMRLLEVVRGKATSHEVIAASMALGKKLGKVAVLSGNCPGFIGNRMMVPYLREAYFLVEEGATVEQVNQALYSFGMAMGPLAMDDLTGLDVSRAIRREFERFEAPGVRKPLVLDFLCKEKRYGQKTGRGWSMYDANRQSSPDLETAALIERTARDAGIERREVSPSEIIDRCIYALVNEGARILEEGIALRPVDIDITYLYGYGFPAWRGGPMFYADTVGLPNVLKRMEEFKIRHGGGIWSPAPLLQELVATGGQFAAFERRELSKED